MIREHSIQIPFLYAAGDIRSRFLIALRDRRQLLGSRCDTCEQVRCPASSMCARCGGNVNALVQVGPEGVLVSWTVTNDDRAFGLVRVDGSHSAMLHWLVGSPLAWSVGSRVRARFAAARTGSILDVEGFEPAEEVKR